MQLKTGEVQNAMSDATASLNQAQQDLGKMGEPKGDPKHLETQLRKLQVLKRHILFTHRSVFLLWIY